MPNNYSCPKQKRTFIKWALGCVVNALLLFKHFLVTIRSTFSWTDLAATCRFELTSIRLQMVVMNWVHFTLFRRTRITEFNLLSCHQVDELMNLYYRICKAPCLLISNMNPALIEHKLQWKVLSHYTTKCISLNFRSSSQALHKHTTGIMLRAYYESFNTVNTLTWSIGDLYLLGHRVVIDWPVSFKTLG